MGWLKNLLGRNRNHPSKDVQRVFEKMRRLLDDDEAQLSMVGGPVASMIRAGLDCDELPGATGRFGYDLTNPIPVNGPIGELSYLSKLRTNRGERLFFHRLGSMGQVDKFEAVDFSGQEWFILYLDMYHPRKTKLAPEGLYISKETSQLTGFTSVVENFPHGIPEAKAKNAGSGINMLYASLAMMEEALGRSSFTRPD